MGVQSLAAVQSCIHITVGHSPRIEWSAKFRAFRRKTSSDPSLTAPSIFMMSGQQQQQKGDPSLEPKTPASSSNSHPSVTPPEERRFLQKIMSGISFKLDLVKSDLNGKIDDRHDQLNDRFKQIDDRVSDLGSKVDYSNKLAIENEKKVMQLAADHEKYKHDQSQ